MKTKTAAFALLAVVTSSMPLGISAELKLAVKHECFSNPDVRTLSVHTDESATGKSVVCRVEYYKSNGASDSRETIWTGRKDPRFCGQKARQLVAKFEQAGFQCDQSIANN